MISVAITPNLHKPQALPLAITIRDYLTQKRVRVVAADDAASALELPPLSQIKSEEVDLVISVGGDGSILNFIHTYPKVDAPVVGVNIGTLGFLADVPVAKVTGALDELISGAYTVQKRLMIHGVTHTGQECYAVNDIVVHRGENHRLVDLALFVDGKYLNTFSADGVIVSTPSGSTAYSLSAGGPILTPDLEAICITPICPHTISNCPIVLPPNAKISIQYLNAYKPVQVLYDGICRFTLAPQERFELEKAERRFSLVALNSVDYFTTLRTKLGWSGTAKGLTPL